MLSLLSGVCLVALLWFAISWLFSLRAKIQQGENVLKGNFIIAMLWMSAAIFFVAVPEVSNFHIVWVLPLCVILGTIAGAGAIGAGLFRRSLHTILWPPARFYANYVILAGSGHKLERRTTEGSTGPPKSQTTAWQYDTFEEWYSAFKQSAGELNPQLKPDEQNKSLIDFMEHEPLRRAYRDRVEPEVLARNFASQFDISTFGRDTRTQQ